MSNHTIYTSQQGKKKLQELYEKALEALHQSFERKTVPTRFGDAHVLITGPKDAPPVFILQGGNTLNPITLSWFKQLLNQYRVYAPDTVGHPGYSSETRVSPKDDSFGRWLTDLMDHFKIEKAWFIGVSYGGGILLRLAAANPERISKAVLVAPAGIALGSKWNMVRKIMVPLINFKISANSKHISKIMGEMASEIMDDLNHEVLEAIFNHVKLEQDMPKLSTREELARFTAPTMVFAGEDDPFFPAKRLVTLSQAMIPNLQDAVWLKGRHFPSREGLECINAKIISFFNDERKE